MSTVRRLLLAILAVGYAATFTHLPSLLTSERALYDPLDRRGRDIERAIEESRFADVRPLVDQLLRERSADPIVAYWHAETLRGLGLADAEAQAWERVLALTALPDAACPALPDAYARAGRVAESLDAYRRCADASPDDAERWLDLGSALQAAGREADASGAFARSRDLDASNPRLPARDAPAVADAEGQ